MLLNVKSVLFILIFNRSMLFNKRSALINHRSALICIRSLLDLLLICTDLNKISVDLRLIYKIFTSIYTNLRRIWSICAWFPNYDTLWCAFTQSHQKPLYEHTEMSAQHEIIIKLITSAVSIILWKELL